MAKTIVKSLIKIRKMITKHFFTGIFILAPIVIVTIVFQWVFGGIVGWIEDVPLKFFLLGKSSEVAGFVKLLIILGVLLVGVLGVSFLGFFSKLYLGRKLLKWVGDGIQRVPFFGTIYTSLEQLSRTFSNNSGGKQFSRVVYLEFPRKEVWAVGFVTGPAHLKGIPDGYLNVFVPTVPNPTSGFHMLVKESEVKDSGLKVDEAFKLILSLGIAQP